MKNIRWVIPEIFIELTSIKPNIKIIFEEFTCTKTMCKVEFIQPSNWLYSVPNLLVIQHLVTLYLGGFDVRVVSEIE